LSDDRWEMGRVAIDSGGGPRLVWEGRPVGDGPVGLPSELVVTERSAGAVGPGTGMVCEGDNLAVMRALRGTVGGRVDLIYLDPPFATGDEFVLQRGGRETVAYRDRWGGGIGSYLTAMYERLVAARELLGPNGSLFLHCDWHASHWLRCLLDEVFGAGCFKNEIVWRYRRWPAKTRVFQRMHDVIFWYGRSESDGHAFEPMYEALAPSTLATFGTRKQVADFSSGRRKPGQLEVETPGAPMSDVWDVGILAPISRERSGYPTQKPEALLRRIVETVTRPGDLVADFFCGSGTTLAVAAKSGRRFIGCDASPVALHATKKRLLALERDGVAGAGFAVARCGARADGAMGPRAEVGLVQRGAEVHVELRAVRGVELDGVDAWSIDDAFDGKVFVHRWSSARARRGEGMATVGPPLAHGGARAVVRLAGADGSSREIALGRGDRAAKVPPAPLSAPRRKRASRVAC
jgi:site-specific DNA-methyltransferase (adenine-specific)